MALTVQKSPTCGCCTLWMDYARSYGFTLTAEKGTFRAAEG